MTETSAPARTVTVRIDGRQVDAFEGELVIDAAERAGIFIPRFCYHPRMAPVGMCRMCLVEMSGPRGFALQPACFFAVAEGQEVRTASERARKAQEGVLEFLLVNHPLDCPVCDKGGECPLQDQALSHGPGESRYVEEKRHWAKPTEIGPLVLLDRERCIQCARCTRFAEEVAGEPMINLAFRSDVVEVATFPGAAFTSCFSGNAIQICPVGALTSPAYRFRSRPWDLEQVESTCTTCAVGCRFAQQSSAGTIVRNLGIDSDPVNQSWLCDKGRYGFEAVHATSRLVDPLQRRGETQVPVAWHEALAAVAEAIGRAVAEGGPESVGFIGGARLSNEDAYAFARLAKASVGTDSVDAQPGDGLPADVVLALPHATLDEMTQASLVLTLTGDLHEELPILYLRLRQAALRGVPVVECSPQATPLSAVAVERLAYLPGEAARLVEALVGDAPVPRGSDAAALGRARLRLRDADEGEGVVVVVGRTSLAEPAVGIGAAARTLADALPKARFLPAVRRANTHGALDMGLAPGLLPGRVTLEAGRAWFEQAWGQVPAAAGRDATAILRAAAAGELSTLVLVGADPLSDFPGSGLAKAALERAGFVVFVGTHPNPSAALADVVLPVAGDGERTGTTTNLEGRVTRLAAKVAPPEVAWPAWTVAVELARRLGRPLGFESIEAIAAEIARLAPAYRGVDDAVTGAADRRDGVVVPLRPVDVSIRQARPRPIDPIATPGILSTEEQGAPLSTGTGLPLGSEDDEPRPGPVSSPPPPFIGLVRRAPCEPSPVAVGAYRLFVRRALYDHGSLVQAAPSLAPLAAASRLFVHPSVLSALAVAPGERLRLRSASGSLVAEAAVDASLPETVVAVVSSLAPAGEGVADLLDGAERPTDVTLERDV